MMKIVEEIVAAGLLGSHVNHGLAAGGNDFLEMQIAAFKFRNDRIEVLDVDRYRLAGRRMELGWLEFTVFHNKRQRNRIFCAHGMRIEQ